MDKIIAAACFDGMHRGHMQLLDEARQASQRYGLPLWAYSSPVHAPRIETAAQTDERLKEQGVEKIIKRGLSAQAEDAMIIAEPSFMPKLDLVRSKSVIHEFRPVSRERIKRALVMGDIKRANALLGRTYSISGKIVHGTGTGHRMGVPTINLIPHDGLLIPCRGVYAARAVIDGQSMPCATNIGVRPTFGENALTVESYIIDRDEDVYGHMCSIELLAYLRPERAFSSPDELVSQIRSDILAVKEYEA